MDQELWARCVAFHGHECPGLAIGYRVCEAAVKSLGVTYSADEETVCVVETDNCAVDAIQVILGCTLGKGNLLYRGTGSGPTASSTGAPARGAAVVRRAAGGARPESAAGIHPAGRPAGIVRVQTSGFPLPETGPDF